jgi:porphobilinogen synthase
MKYPESRPRRLRRSESIRRLVRETRVSVDDLVFPLFVSELVDGPTPIKSMPGISNLPVGSAADEAARAFDLGIPAVILFGTPSQKNPTGSEAQKKDGIVQKAVAAIKKRTPDLLFITDVCLCENTDPGHCGIVKNGRVDNDATLAALAGQAVSHAKAGVDMVAPSDMMDGRVAAIRRELDSFNFEDVGIMAYSAKYCSAFYGPFREAVDSAPQFGDRRGYQMDPANTNEAMKEIQLDIDEGADIVMVKPALAYLDIVARARARFDLPIAAYNVSGEYAMVKFAAQAGAAEEQRLVLEILGAIKRAGADIIITYHALDAARWLA